MESNLENNKRQLKVVWLCHFANEEMKGYFKVNNVNEFAPWINLSLDLFEKVEEVELHLVSPNIFTNQDAYLEKRGIHYHFFKYLPSLFYNRYSRKIHSVLNIAARSNFYWIRKKVAKKIRFIDPDIIHLHGAENAFFYSSGILPLIGEYPIITTIQGFVRNSVTKDRMTLDRMAMEDKIIRSTTEFAIRQTDEMKNIMEEMHPGASLYYHNYPVGRPKRKKDNIGEKEPIDFIFFARVCKDKGIEDLLQALAMVKMEIPDVNLTVVGGVDFTYRSHLDNMCESLGITDNVSFKGFLPTQHDIHTLAYDAKVCVLPTYHDILPGTVLESMFLKLPVIAYSVGGLPELNEKQISIDLVELKNINALAERMIHLYRHAGERQDLADRGFTYAENRFNNAEVVSAILNAYHQILAKT